MKNLIKSCAILSVVILAAIMTISFFSHNNSKTLSAEEIAELRNIYPTVDEHPAYVDTLVPEDWGANFEVIFDHYDAVIKGTMTSDIWETTKKVTMVDLDDWDGDLEELEKQNPALVNSTLGHVFWTIEVEEVIWQSKTTAKIIKTGDKLLMTDSALMFNYGDLLKKDNSYILPIGYHETEDAWTFLKPGGFHVTDDDYLFSFKSGENTNKYTGSKEKIYVNALKNANNTWEREIKSGTYEEIIDYLE
ncbi:MAG: hypothetical protein K5858_01185 [Lachnospiraceae bacterium]|nr:hypothetical protein [Lachnospiraceae bacterium]